jgi:hypothetical protein
MTSGQICVYTALFGNYERLNPQPMARDSDVAWICFSDDSELTSDDWEIVVVEPAFAHDPHRSSRRLKMLGHPLVHECASSLWIDNSVVLDADPRTIIATWLGDCDIAFASHGFRSTVLDEFSVVLDDELDDPSRIIEQLEHYARTRPQVLDERPLWGGMFARRWAPEVERAMHVWWEHLLRYSRRDQLSLVYALDSVGLVPRRVEIDNYESEWHRWPVTPERNNAMRTRTTDAALRRPLARVFELEREVARLQDELAVARADFAQLCSGLEATRDREVEHERARNAAERRLVHLADIELPAVAAELERHRELLADVHQDLERAASDRTRLEQAHTELQRVHNELGRQLAAASAELEAIRGSRSWRIARGVSRPLHAVADPLRRR